MSNSTPQGFVLSTVLITCFETDAIYFQLQGVVSY